MHPLAGKKKNKEEQTGKNKKTAHTTEVSKTPEDVQRPAEVKRTRVEQLKSSAPYGVLLSIILAIAFYIRAVLPYDSVFLADGTIRFGGNDPWYHMRLVHALLNNYPHAMFYDAHAIPPYGWRRTRAGERWPAGSWTNEDG